MAAEIIFPKLDEAMVSGKLLDWMKKEGDRVEKGEPLFVVETEKVTFEVEVPESGILSSVTAKAGEVVSVGQIVAFVLQPGEVAPEVPQPVAQAREGAKEAQEIKASPIAREEAEGARELKTSPLARRIAEEHGIDLSHVVGTGPGGRIVKEDVLRAVEEASKAKKPEPLAGEVEEAKPASAEPILAMTSMRETVARRMSQSFQSAPHFYLSVEADAAELGRMREELAASIEKAVGVRLTYTDLLLKIVARAVEDHPEINVAWADGGIKKLSEINIGLAVAVADGLIVPVIQQVNLKSLTEIARARSDISKRAGEGKITLSEMRGGSLTLTNLGMFGIDRFEAIINPPESCILATGRIAEKPAAVRGELTIRPQMNLTLSLDHRVLDGVSGARFLQRIKELIEQPFLMLL